MKEQKLLNGLPVRVREFDGLFTIEVAIEAEYRDFSWPWQSKKPIKKVITWHKIDALGRPTLWCPSGGGTYNWSNGSPISDFDSLGKATMKIDSLNKGVIIHEL